MSRLFEERANEEEKCKDLNTPENHEQRADKLCPGRQHRSRIQICKRSDAACGRQAGDRQRNRFDGAESRKGNEESTR